MAFKRQVVAITGAGGGMGRAVAIAFARCGATVALCDVSAQGLAGTAQACEPANAMSAVVDIRNVHAVQKWFADIDQTVGKCRILVNCAGIWRSDRVEDVTEPDWITMVDVNLKGTFFCCQQAIGQMRAVGGGAIVNIASAAGETGSIRPAAPYAASKGGVIALTKSLAREVAPLIRVNAVSPGPVDTAMLAETEEEKRQIAKRPLVQRLGTPNDIAEGILYLCGAEYVTGTVLQVNGGSLI